MTRLALAAALCVVAVGSPVLAARPVPFKASIDTVIAVTGFCGATCVVLNTSGSGQTTHMGRVSVDGPTLTDFGALTQTGTSTFTAADGSELVFHVQGTFHFTSATDVAFSGAWTVISGTGRFSDSNGGGTYQGTGSVALNTGELQLSGSVSDTGNN